MGGSISQKWPSPPCRRPSAETRGPQVGEPRRGRKATRSHLETHPANPNVRSSKRERPGSWSSGRIPSCPGFAVKPLLEIHRSLTIPVDPFDHKRVSADAMLPRVLLLLAEPIGKAARKA